MVVDDSVESKDRGPACQQQPAERWRSDDARPRIRLFSVYPRRSPRRVIEPSGRHMTRSHVQVSSRCVAVGDLAAVSLCLDSSCVLSSDRVT